MPRAAPEDDSSYAIPDILNFSKRLIVGVQIVGCVLIFLYAIALISYGFTVGVHYSLAGQRLAYIMISLGTVLALHSFLGIQAARYQVLGWCMLFFALDILMMLAEAGANYQLNANVNQTRREFIKRGGEYGLEEQDLGPQLRVRKYLCGNFAWMTSGLYILQLVVLYTSYDLSHKLRKDAEAERKNKEKFEAGNTEEGDENESDAFIKPASGRNSSRSPDATEAGGTGSSPGTGRGGNQKASGDIDG